MPGRMICFVCGSPGADTPLRTRQHDRDPYFPFLSQHEPPKGCRMPTADGIVDSCAVCYMFLTQQWDSYERSKTPAVKRLYWLKRLDNGNFTGAEMRVQGEYIAQVMGLQYPPGVDDRGSPEQRLSTHQDRDINENSNSVSMFNNSYRDHAMLNSNNASEQHPKSSVLDLSTSKKKSSDYKGLENECKSICYACGTSYIKTEHSVINVFDQRNGEPFFPIFERINPFPGSDGISPKGQVGACNLCKSMLFQQWQAYEMTGTPLALRHFKLSKEGASEIKPETYETNNGTSQHCYICGDPFPASQLHLLDTLPPRSPSTTAMFFPFVRELKRQPGAEPLRSDGTVITCFKCYDNLRYQWNQLENAGVPVYHRQYSLQFLSGHKTSGDALSDAERPERTLHQSSQEERIEPLNVHISTSSSPLKQSDHNSGGPSFQPGLLAIASEPDNRPVSRTSELSVSPVKFCDSGTADKTNLLDGHRSSSSKTVPHPLQQVTEIPKRVCFLCSEKCIIHKMNQLHAYPARHEAKHLNGPVEPFFPFLTSCNPSSGAEPLTEEGTVIVCKLCYYSLIKQWVDFEQSSSMADSNRWTRKYTLPNYVCYVCAIEGTRRVMRTIVVKNFNFLLEHSAPKGSLVIDEGQRVVVCKTCAYSLMKQFTEFERMGVPHKLRKFNWIQKTPNTIGENEEESQGADVHRELLKSAANGTDDDDDEHSLPGPLGSKPQPLNLMSPAGSKQARNTATVSPLHHVTSPTNGVNTLGGSAALNASRTSSFAAALRKLANQAKEPAEEGTKTSVSNNSPRTTSVKSSPSLGGNAGGSGPPLMYTSTTLTSPPVVTIAPTQSHPHILPSDARPPLERLHSAPGSVFESVSGKHERPHSSASRDEDRASSRDNHSHHSARRLTPHSTPGASSPLMSSSRDEAPTSSSSGGPRGFQPYRPGDDLRPPLATSLALDPAAAAAAYSAYPAFLPPHAFPHPAFRFDDPLLLERYRMLQSPYLPYAAAQGMLGHPGLHPLLSGARYPPDMFPPPGTQFPPFSQPGRLPHTEHRSPSLMSDRQEEKHRELEREREREMVAARDRQRALEREAERQRETRDRHRETGGQSRETSGQGREYRSNSLDTRDSRSSEHNIGSKFGSIIQGTSTKGLGIADRYPRLSPANSGGNSGSRKDEHRPTRDEHTFHKNLNNKSPSEDSEKRFSLVNPLREGHKSGGPPPLVSPRTPDDSRAGATKSHDTGLFRPFDSQHVVNGYENDRNRNIEQFQSHAHKRDSHSRSLDSKLKLESSQSSSSSSSVSAFHKLNNRISEQDSLSRSSATLSKDSQNSIYSAPLNVPAYNFSILQSEISPGGRNASKTSGLTESQGSAGSRGDLQERRKADPRGEKSACSDSECDSVTDEDKQGRRLLMSSGSSVKVETSPKKVKLFTDLSLTAYNEKKEADFERWRKRRNRTKEQNLSQMSAEDSPPTSHKASHTPDELCREPDYKKKCHFLSQNLQLTPVPAETRKVNEAVWRAVEQEKMRRRYGIMVPDILSPSSATSGLELSLLARDLNPQLAGGQGRENLKRKLDEDYDDVFNFAAHEQRTSSVVAGFERQLSNSSTSSIGKFTPRTTMDISERGKLDQPSGSATKSQRPNSLSKSFAHEFHESVLQTTRQKELLRASSDSGRLSDTSPMSGHYPRYSPWSQDSVVDGGWPGIEAVMEAYNKHQQGERAEKQILIERNRQLKSENAQLSTVWAQLNQRMDEMMKNKRQLDELRQYNQECIDSIKISLRKLK